MKKLYFLFTAFSLFTSVNAQVINFPDDGLRQTLLLPNQYQFTVNPATGFPYNVPQPVARNVSGSPMVVDSNYNGQIEVSEAQNVYTLDLTPMAGQPIGGGPSYSFSNLSGLENFTNLRNLTCGSIVTFQNSMPSLISFGFSSNTLSNLNIIVSRFPNLTNLSCSGTNLIVADVSLLTNLKNLSIGNSSLATINVAQNTTLEYLYCESNQLKAMVVTKNINLKELRCGFNQISSLNISNNNALQVLYCYNNNLSNLNVSQNPDLIRLNCANNQISDLDLSQNNNLQEFSCYNTQVTTLDLSQKPNLYNIGCGNNNFLTYLNVKNGLNGSVSFQGTPNLRYICADDGELTAIQNSIDQYGYSNCHVNSYCSFDPGGTYYTIEGNNKFDSNNNGCDNLDIKVPNLKYNITNGTTSGTLVSGFLGNYTIPVQAGTHTITPIINNPSYFTVSPTSLVANFPTQSSPLIQNFCVTANGNHSDVEMYITPLDRARPGFDARYSIVLLNSGNQIENGSVNFNYDDSKIDFVSADVAPIQSTGILTWNYTNLQPFGFKAFEVTLNLNSPMETPSVNGGDVLSFTANGTIMNTDETPLNNSFTFNQTVVNSFDPNDITCLEGSSVSTAKIGDYVHYLIRFENNGSTEATNIVVKEVVDANKFDINTLVPYDANYDYYTRINGNNVEFIFENIYLPFDDANNDGYLAFKIKLKSNLVAGDTFSKNASIYFDYNFPIVTNTATTTIAALSTQDFEFKNYFSLYPNPVQNVLNITAKETIEISSINIYNTLGQLVLVIPNAQNTKTVDVSSLTSGNYFIKINSDKGTSNTKFIKE